jgi:hypothetical protein
MTGCTFGKRALPGGQSGIPCSATLAPLRAHGMRLEGDAGYNVRDPSSTVSTMKTDYIWDEEEIEYMKAQRMLDKRFNRRRDEHTQYVEARAFYEAMMGKAR